MQSEQQIIEEINIKSESEDDDLLNGNTELEITENFNKKQQLNKITFKCPEDDVECSYKKPDQLPKNYALLKIVQRTRQSEEDKSKNIIELQYHKEEQKFVAQKKEDKSLANYLSQPQIQNNCQIVSQQQPLASDFSSDQEQVKVAVCQVHNRPLELICVTDKTRICAQCALFGMHKGHDVRMEDEVQKEIELKVEVLMEMYQAVEQSCQDLSNPINYEKQYGIFKQKQNEMKEKIQDKFKEWRKSLRAMEMKVIDQLFVTYQPFEEKFALAQKQNNKMMGEAHQWMSKAKQSLDDYTIKIQNDQKFIDFDMIDSKSDCLADEILTQGEHIYEKAEKQKDFPSLSGLEYQYGQIRLWFEPCIEKKLANIAKVLPPGQSESSSDLTTVSGSFLPPFSFNEEEENQEVLNQNTNGDNGLNISDISFNELSSPINQTMTTDKLSQESRLKIQHDVTITSNNSSENQKGNISQNQISQFSKLRKISTTSVSNQNDSAQKQSQLPVPGSKKKDLASTFKQDAQNGELDLSNRGLSDMHVNDLAKCIKSYSAHIQSLNLSKNKLSDEGISHIMKALCESSIEQISLQGNKLTDKCAENIVGILKTNKTLKVMDLQGNSIVSRLMKNKLKNALTQIEVLI